LQSAPIPLHPNAQYLHPNAQCVTLPCMTVFSVATALRGRGVTVKPEFLYHATPRHNMLRIEQTGVIDVLLRYPERLSPDNWFTEEKALGWSIAHAALRHRVGMHDVFVYRVITPANAKKHFGKGLYRVPEPVTVSTDELPQSAATALAFLIRHEDEIDADYWNFTGWASEERLRGIV